MRRARIREAILGASVLLSVLVGCGGGNSSDEEDEDVPVTVARAKVGGKTDDGPPSANGIRPGPGTLKGKVIVTDKAALDLTKLNADMLKLLTSSNDHKHCAAEAPADQKEQQDWRISADGGLEDVFIFLRPPQGKFFALENAPEAVKDKKVLLDQPHCVFVPHSLMLFPSYRNPWNREKPTGQQLIVKNSAQIAHNTKYGDGGGRNPGDNKSLGAGTELVIPTFKPSMTPVSVDCNVHPWMHADMWVMDHPYYAITDKNGNYEIKNVPVGSFSIVAWHGKAKYINQGELKGEEVTLTEKGGDKSFEYKPK